jgi:hypothetical protein
LTTQRSSLYLEIMTNLYKIWPNIERVHTKITFVFCDKVYKISNRELRLMASTMVIYICIESPLSIIQCPVLGYRLPCTMISFTLLTSCYFSLQSCIVRSNTTLELKNIFRVFWDWGKGPDGRLCIENYFKWHLWNLFTWKLLIHTKRIFFCIVHIKKEVFFIKSTVDTSL